jgi:hypothetical protein
VIAFPYPRSARRRGGAAPVLVLAALVLTGCAGGSRAESAESSARAFEQAVSQGDGAAACGLLAPETAAEVAQAAGSSCAQGVVGEDLPDGGAVQDSSVWGRSAQVRMSADTLFLSHFDGGWRVLAAGCTARPGKPYDCTVQGG